VPRLYAAGADYVSVPRLAEARLLCDVVLAALDGDLAAKRAALDQDLENRREVIV
jgi:hypothetical protein